MQRERTEEEMMGINHKVHLLIHLDPAPPFFF